MFAKRYPEFFEPHETTLEFLLTLNEMIHPEVRKLSRRRTCRCSTTAC